MAEYFLSEDGFAGFLAKLMAGQPVIGPVARKNEFAFAELESPADLRLDYDVTILPPKAVFFPPKQKLLEFTETGVKSCIDPRKQVLLGVHFYDVKGIDMLDHLFNERFVDNNYMANREATTIVASNIQNVSKRAFWSSVGTEVAPKGHDAFLTKLAGGYLLEVCTEKGKDLLKHGTFQPATPAQIAEAKKVNEAVMDKCEEKLTHSTAEIEKKTRDSFKKNSLWEAFSQDCFSCGACNLVCSTCYCFDVQDTWHLDQKSGERCRSWDGCMLEDFSKVSLGGGHHENFREERSSRFRHRIMRKATYLNPKLGGPACTGCGRCTIACVPDIADPVKILNKIMSEA